MTIATRIYTLLGVATLVLGAAACSQAIAEVPCDQLRVGSADAAVLMLSDGRSPALDRTTSRLVDDPEAFFRSRDLGLDAAPGIVVLATTGADGEMVEHGAFNLGGVGGDDVRRKGNAANQARCLAETVDALPAAPDAPDDRANLLRSLATASAQLRSLGAEQSALVVHGFGRSDNDGFVPAETDLSVEARPTVLATIDSAGIVPRLDVPVALVAPAEDIPTGIGAAEVRAFSAELCQVLSSARCVSVDVLG